MHDRLVVTETMRFPFKRHRWRMRFLHARIYLIDWDSKKIRTQIISPKAYHVEEYRSLAQAYQYHGARGVTSNGRDLFIAGQNVIFVCDTDLNVIRRINHRLFNGLHELDWFDGKLYVTSAVTDSVLTMDEQGELCEQHYLGNDASLLKSFGLKPRELDSAIDYRLIHKARRLYHVNSVQATVDGVYAGLNRQGAFVRINPSPQVLIADNRFKNCHNAQFTPDRGNIVMNDTNGFSLRIFDLDGREERQIDLRRMSLPIRFSERTVFGDGHEIRAGWLRGMAFSVTDLDVVYLGLSPASVIAVNYRTGRLVDYIQLRRDIWITVHGLYNLATAPPPQDRTSVGVEP